MSSPGVWLVLVSVLLTAAACGTDAPAAEEPLSFDGISVDAARDVPSVGPYDGRPGPSGGTILDPASQPIEHGLPYRFSLGHCGLNSPLDVDGSFWEALDGVTSSGQPLDLEGDPEMINQTAGVIVVIDDEARFRTETGSIVRFARHAGDREFPGCD